MTAAMMVERGGMTGMGMAGPTGMMGAPAGTTAGMNMTMVPRCTMAFEKCTGGMKITCKCDDTVSAAMLQNLCSMTAGGLCSCCVMMNGMMVCCCNLMMGMCKCEPTDDGVCITCTSGDKACCAMIQSCCECMASMMKAGCTCCVMMNNMPVCCGCC
jgi:hypothetical protein